MVLQLIYLQWLFCWSNGFTYCWWFCCSILFGLALDNVFDWVLGSPVTDSCCFVEETYAPLILVDKAQDIRERTGNWGVHAVHEHVRIDLHEIVSNTIARPIKMLFSEPIILMIAIYNGFTYLILYLCLSSYPYTFVGKYKWSLGKAMLPYIGILIGEFISCIVMVLL